MSSASQILSLQLKMHSLRCSHHCSSFAARNFQVLIDNVMSKTGIHKSLLDVPRLDRNAVSLAITMSSTAQSINLCTNYSGWCSLRLKSRSWRTTRRLQPRNMACSVTMAILFSWIYPMAGPSLSIQMWALLMSLSFIFNIIIFLLPYRKCNEAKG